MCETAHWIGTKVLWRSHLRGLWQCPRSNSLRNTEKAPADFFFGRARESWSMGRHRRTCRVAGLGLVSEISGSNPSSQFRQNDDGLRGTRYNQIFPLLAKMDSILSTPDTLIGSNWLLSVCYHSPDNLMFSYVVHAATCISDLGVPFAV